MLRVKQGGIVYHFLSFWYDSISRAIGETQIISKIIKETKIFSDWPSAGVRILLPKTEETLNTKKKQKKNNNKKAKNKTKQKNTDSSHAFSLHTK